MALLDQSRAPARGERLDGVDAAQRGPDLIGEHVPPALDLGLGRQYHLQRRIHSGESVSQVLFETALKLADNRGLVNSTEPDLAQWRSVFADQIRTTLRQIDAIEALAASRRAGLIE